jgi:hypothetical protein
MPCGMSVGNRTPEPNSASRRNGEAVARPRRATASREARAIPGPSFKALFLQSEGGWGHHPSLRLLSELRLAGQKTTVMDDCVLLFEFRQTIPRLSSEALFLQSEGR